MFRQVRLLKLIFLGLLFVGCREGQGQALSFETIQQSHYSAWEQLEPGLIIITHQEEIAAVEPFIQEQEVRTALSQVDLTDNLVIIAFRGQQDSMHGGFQVEHIERHGRNVMLQAQPGELSGQAIITSPYHLIKIQKERGWNKQFTFNLYFGEDQPAVASVSHFVE